MFLNVCVRFEVTNTFHRVVRIVFVEADTGFGVRSNARFCKIHKKYLEGFWKMAKITHT